jgi:acyl carrier protein
LEATISAVAARCLRSSHVPVDAATPFALLGLDSLTTIELAVALEETLGCELPPGLLAEYPDVGSLARHLADADIVARVSIDDPFDRMLADSVLPDDVRPRERADAAAIPALLDARDILLTGATGFLGAWLAREILDRSHATLHCIVRPSAQRLRSHLLAHGVEPAIFDSRIRVVEGDRAPAPRMFGDAVRRAGARGRCHLPRGSRRQLGLPDWRCAMPTSRARWNCCVSHAGTARRRFISCRVYPSRIRQLVRATPVKISMRCRTCAGSASDTRKPRRSAKRSSGRRPNVDFRPRSIGRR